VAQGAAHLEMILKKRKDWIVNTLLQSVFSHFDEHDIVERFENAILNKLRRDGFSEAFWEWNSADIGKEIVREAMSAEQDFAGTHDLTIVMAEQLSSAFNVCYMKALVIESILDDDNDGRWGGGSGM
jgi:hypothetical protein